MTLASFAASNYATGGDVTFTISFVFYFSFVIFVVIYVSLTSSCIFALGEI